MRLVEGESYTRQIPLKGINGPLPAGEYEVQVEYYAKTRKFVEGATGELKSNIARLRIER